MDHKAADGVPIRGSVLSHQTICAMGPDLIVGFNEERAQAASYDLTLGHEYYLHQKRGKYYIDQRRRVMRDIHRLDTGDILSIGPNDVCLVITEEEVSMPNDICGRLSLRFGLLMRGIIMAPQTQIDPGYHGKIVALLYNLSNDHVLLRRGDHIVTIEFNYLDKPTTDAYDYKAKYYGLHEIKDAINSEIISSLSQIKKDARKTKRRITNSIPTLLTIITIILGILTIFIALIAADKI